MTAMMGGDLMGVREAARAIGVNASTISRQIAKGIIPNRGTAERPMVSLSEARHARSTGLDVSKQRGATSPLFAGTHPAPSQPARTPAAPRPTYTGAPTGESPRQRNIAFLNDGSEEPLSIEEQDEHLVELDQRAGAPPAPPREREEPKAAAAPADAETEYRAPRQQSAFAQVRTAREGFAAKNAQLDYLERRGRLVGQHGVQEATADVFRTLRDRVLAIASTVAGRLATMQDEREIRVLLRAEISRSLTDASESIDDRDPDPLDPEDRGPGDHGDDG